MIKFSKYLLVVFFVLFFSIDTYSQSREVRYSRSQPEIIKEMKKREQIIMQRLSYETDPQKRKELIRKQIQIQNLYYDQDIKREAIRSLSPDYIKNLKPYEAEEKLATGDDDKPPIDLFIANSREWESYQAEQKIRFCAQMRKECETKNALDYCRFVVVKCRSFVREEDYQNLIKKYNSRSKRI